MTNKTEAGCTDRQPYDSAFRTILSDLTPFSVYLVNVLFGTRYTEQAEITQYQTEYVNQKPCDQTSRRVMGSIILIREGDASDRVHIDVESSPVADGSMERRMFQVESYDALANRYVDEEGREVAEFPLSGLICLRSLPGRPAALETYIETSGARLLQRTQILYADEYDLEKIKKNELLVLAPFLLFRHADNLDEIDGDPKKLEDLRKEMEQLRDFYQEWREEEKISGEQLGQLMEVTRRISDHLAAKQTLVRKAVDEVIG